MKLGKIDQVDITNLSRAIQYMGIMESQERLPDFPILKVIQALHHLIDLELELLNLSLLIFEFSKKFLTSIS